MATVDVTVVGAGIFGLSIGYVCATRGARVRVVDRAGIGAGASGGIVGALSPHTPENWNAKKQFQFESLLASRGFWPEVDARSGVSSGYGQVGRLQPIADARAVELAWARGESAKGLWHGQADWTVISAHDAWSPPSPTGLLIHDTLSARLHPQRACESLAGAIRALGGEIAIGETANDGRIIWATGSAGLQNLSMQLGKPVGAGIKGQALLLRHDAGGAAQLFIDGLHVIAHDDGTVAIGSTSEREFNDPVGTDALLDDLHKRAIATLPQLGDAPVIQRWAGVRPRAKSRAPMLGAWPGRPWHFIANGGFKIGFGMAPKVAEVMADMVLDGRDVIPEGFRVEANL